MGRRLISGLVRESEGRESGDEYFSVCDDARIENERDSSGEGECS